MTTNAAIADPAAKPTLDHIVILIPQRVLKDLPAWIREPFRILDGGKHADGLTENKLILFEDGVYIELISFVEGADPEARKKHRWGRRLEGRIVDWALTLSGDENGSPVGGPGPEEAFKTVQHRVRAADAGVVYGDAVAGGRVTPGGTELRWAVAGPEVLPGEEESVDVSLDGGEAPFWCLDRTPRRLRVPHEAPGNAAHPSGVVGFAAVALFVPGDGPLGVLRRVYDGIYGEPGTLVQRADAPRLKGYRWDMSVPVPGVVGSRNTRHLFVWSLEGQDQGQGQDTSGTSGDTTSISLTLYSRGTAGRIEGVLHGGWKVEVDLIKPE